MATPAESAKILCFLCNKAKGIYKCEGCSQIFCPNHSVDHRNELNTQLEEIAVTHDQIHQTLNQQIEDPRQHPSIKKINQWEQSSIDKIRLTAEKARNDVLKSSTQCTTQVKQKLQTLSNELKQGREENDFSEIDLRQWKQKLKGLRKDIFSPGMTDIQENSTPLINCIYIGVPYALDVFDRVAGSAEIRESGRIVVKDSSIAQTEIRGKYEYNTGIHKLRFQVEQLNGWIFFGIISKSQSMQVNSFHSPSSYGWSNKNQIYVGISGQVTGEPTIEIIQNDMIILSIDCDQRTIQLKNERLKQTIELAIDINKCSFPWQLHLNLYAANTQVRILDPAN